jgi:hypothetical protein
MKNLNSRWLIFCYIVLLSLLAACGLKNVAGTSSGVDNPNLSIHFAKNSKKTSITGSLNIYTSNQNPLLEPLPTISIPIQGEDSTQLSSKNLLTSTVNSLLKNTSTTITDFNIFIETPNGIEGAVIGIRFDSSNSSFYQDGRLVNSPLQVNLQDRQRYNGAINFDISDVMAQYAYILGTPYRSIVNGNAFLFDSIAYNLNLPLNILGNDGYSYSSSSLSNTIGDIPLTQELSVIKIDSPVEVVNCDSLFLLAKEQEEDLIENEEEALYYLIEAHCEGGKDLVDSLTNEP